MQKHHMLFFMFCLLAASINNYAMKVENYLERVKNKCEEYKQEFPVCVRSVNDASAKIEPYCQKKASPDSQHKILAIYFKKGLLLKFLDDSNYLYQVFLLRRANQELGCIKQYKRNDNCVDCCEDNCVDPCGDHCVDCLYALFEKPISLNLAKYYYNQISAVECVGTSEPLYYKYIL